MKKIILHIFSCVLTLTAMCSWQGCADKCSTNDRYLVVKTYAGTSNRLRTLASAKIMAAVTDRQLLIEWPILENEMPARFADLFNNPLTMFEDSPLARQGCKLENLSLAKRGDQMILNLGSQNNTDGQKRLSEIVKDKEPIVYFGTSLNFWPNSDVLSSDDFWAKYRLYYQNLEPNTYIVNGVKSFEKDNDFAQFFMVGVHYRSWGTGSPDSYVTNDPENRYLNQFIDKMKEAINLPPSSRDNKEVKFFIATDDAKIKEKLSKESALANRIITRDAEIGRATIEGQKDALIDWYLLGRTNYIIGTYQSSFSDEAAHLTKQNKKINIGDSPFNK